MPNDTILITPDTRIPLTRVTRNPDDAFYHEFLKDYYVITADGQYLFGSTQPGRRPDRAFFLVPEGYKLGYKQRSFDDKVGKRVYEAALAYLAEENVPMVVMDGIQGEAGYEVGLRFAASMKCRQSGYITWFAKQMVFPAKEGQSPDCWNVIVPERLPDKYVAMIREVWPDYDPNVPITLYDLTGMDDNVRMVLSLGVDYFGGDFKKPNLTMVWNKAEGEGLISYHAGSTTDRVLKGLSGTGKTTLTVGPDLEQDDALLGRPEYDEDGNVSRVQIIGLEAASYAKSEGLYDGSPEWAGLMRSKMVNPDGSRPVVLCQNMDCENVEYEVFEEGGKPIKVPRVQPGKQPGHLLCQQYHRSGTTNGRFIFLFSELNPQWGETPYKYMKTEALSFKKFDVLEPMFRVTDPIMAVALDSACESIITSAIAAQRPGTRVRSYSATDFMAREQCHQALLKLKVYTDLGLGMDGKMVFFISNAGFVGEYDMDGEQIKLLDENGEPIPKMDKEMGKQMINAAGDVVWIGQGEKIGVRDSKGLIDLVEHRKIKNWLKHPVFGYLLPDPKELEEVHGMKDFGTRFNPLNYYTPEEYIAFAEREIRERTAFLAELFSGQEGEDDLQDVIHVWDTCTIPSKEELVRFYTEHYGPCKKA